LGNRPHIRARWPLALAGLWLFSCWFLLGDLGYWNDDYFICSRDPATGAVTRWIMDRATPFSPASGPLLTWRPLYNITLAGVTALFWQSPWVMHLIGALAHLGCVLAVWRLLGELGRTPQAAFAGAALFCCSPLGFEAVFWTCAIPTALSAWCYIGASVAFARWCRKGLRGDALWCVMLAACVPCFNEQAAAGVAAWPLLAMAVRQRAMDLRKPVVRVLSVIAAVGLLYAVYIAVVVASSRAGAGIGSAGQLTPPRHLPWEAKRILKQLEDLLKFEFVGLGGLSVGWRTIMEHPLRAALFGVLIVVLWGRCWSLWREHDPESRNGDSPSKRWWTAFGGLGLGAATVLPLIVVAGTAVRPRMGYIISAGLAIVIVTVGDAFARRCASAKPGKAYHTLAGIALAVACALGSLGMIGVQRGYQARHELDERVAAQLRELIPDPGSGAVMMPLASMELPFFTRSPRFDTYFIGPWYHSWAYPTYARHVFGRSDIDATCFWFDRPVFLDADGRGVRFAGELPWDFLGDDRGDGGRWIPWDRAVPFIISREGEVRLVTEIRFVRGGEEVLSAKPPRTQGKAEFVWTVAKP
jgi:hypothetical protein